MKGTLLTHAAHGGVASDFVFVANKIGGKYMLFGFADEASGLDNFLVMEK